MFEKFETYSYSFVKPKIKCTTICDIGTIGTYTVKSELITNFTPSAPTMTPSQDPPSAPTMTKNDFSDLPPSYEEALKISKK